MIKFIKLLTIVVAAALLASCNAGILRRAGQGATTDGADDEGSRSRNRSPRRGPLTCYFGRNCTGKERTMSSSHKCLATIGKSWSCNGKMTNNPNYVSRSCQSTNMGDCSGAREAMEEPVMGFLNGAAEGMDAQVDATG